MQRADVTSYVPGATLSRGGLLFTKRNPRNESLDAALDTCAEVDVVVASNKPDVCLAVFDSRLPVYTMLRVDTSKGALLEAEGVEGALELVHAE